MNPKRERARAGVCRGTARAVICASQLLLTLALAVGCATALSGATPTATLPTAILPTVALPTAPVSGGHVPTAGPLPQRTRTSKPVPPTSTAFPSATLTPAWTSSPTGTPTATSTKPAPSSTPTPVKLEAPAIVAEVELRVSPGYGSEPFAMAILGDRLYVANLTTANVSVIQNGQVVSVLPVGANPVAVVANPDNGEVYVLNQGDNSISVLANDKLARTLPTGKSPTQLARVGDQLVVATGQGELSVLDPQTGEVMQQLTLDTMFDVLAMAVDPTRNLLIACTYNETHVVDTLHWEKLYKLTMSSYSTLAVSPALGRFYISNYDATASQQYLVAVDSADGKLLGQVPIGGDPRGAAVDEGTGRVYVADSFTNDVSVVNEEPFEPEATVPVNLRPIAVVVDAETDRIYVANEDSDNISAIDSATNQVVATIPVRIQPAGIALGPDGRAYVANPSTNSVLVVENGSVVGEYPVGSNPVGVALDPRTDRLYVANQGDGTGSVLDAKSGEVLKIVPAGSRPVAAAVGPQANRAYVGEAVLDAETLEQVGTLILSTTSYGLDIIPQVIAIDQAANRLYVVAFNGIPGSNGANIIYVVNGADLTVPNRWADGGNVTSIALDAQGGRIYAASSRMGSSLVEADGIDTGQAVVGPVTLTGYPACLAFNPATGHVFLGLSNAFGTSQAPQVLVFDRDLKQLLALPFRGEPSAMTFDPATGRVYVSDSARGYLAVIQDVALGGGS